MGHTHGIRFQQQAAGKVPALIGKQATIDQVRKFNGCAEKGESCGASCTLYPSSKGAAVETFIHPYGHFYPPAVTEVIVKFFKRFAGANITAGGRETL